MNRKQQKAKERKATILFIACLFGYSILDKDHISIWKNGIEHKIRVIDVGEKDGEIRHDATKDPIEITGGVKALFDD